MPTEWMHAWMHGQMSECINESKNEWINQYARVVVSPVCGGHSACSRLCLFHSDLTQWNFCKARKTTTKRTFLESAIDESDERDRLENDRWQFTSHLCDLQAGWPWSSYINSLSHVSSHKWMAPYCTAHAVSMRSKWKDACEAPDTVSGVQ